MKFLDSNETPPPAEYRRVNPTKLDREVEELKANPGQWALVREATSAGAAAPFRKRGCEVIARFTYTTNTDQRRYDVYARWPQTPTESEVRLVPPKRRRPKKTM